MIANRSVIRWLVDDFIDTRIGLAWNDSDIIEELLKHFTRKDLEELGYKNLIREYFEEG